MGSHVCPWFDPTALNPGNPQRPHSSPPPPHLVRPRTCFVVGLERVENGASLTLAGVGLPLLEQFGQHLAERFVPFCSEDLCYAVFEPDDGLSARLDGRPAFVGEHDEFVLCQKMRRSCPVKSGSSSNRSKSEPLPPEWWSTGSEMLVGRMTLGPHR